MLGEHKLSSPSTRLKVNHLCIRYLCFEYVRGDLQEGNGCASRCQLPLFGAYPNLPEHKIGIFVRFWGLEPSFSGISSTKSRFLCVFSLLNPHFIAFRAQNRHFCALLPFKTPIFRHFEHKIEVFVLGFSILAGNYWTWSVVQRGGARRGTYLLTIWL